MAQQENQIAVDKALAVQKHGDEIIVLLKEETGDVSLLSCLEAATKLVMALQDMNRKDATNEVLKVVKALYDAHS